MSNASSLVPTIVTGVVALCSAALSASIAMYSLVRQGREQRDSRSQETALNLLPRRLDAFESVWRGLLAIEQERAVSQQTADALVATSIWLPAELRTALLELLLAESFDEARARRVRSLLLRDAAIENVDVAMRRLSASKEARRGG